MRRRATTVLAGLVLLGACSSGCSGGGSGGPAVRELTALDAAISRVNDTRRVVTADADRVVAAAHRLDEADAHGAAGDDAALRRARPAVRRAVGLAVPALRALAGHVTAYTAALSELDRAALTPGLSAAQREALRAVVTAGVFESDRTAAFGRVALGVWPRFQALDGAQDLWLQRARAGWYRSRQEAADAYAVLRREDQIAVARRALGQADAARAQAAASTAEAMTAARRALAPLLETPPS